MNYCYVQKAKTTCDIKFTPCDIKFFKNKLVAKAKVLKQKVRNELHKKTCL